MNNRKIIEMIYMKLDFLLDSDRKVFSDFFVKDKENINRLYELLSVIDDNKKEWEYNGLKYEFEKDTYKLSIGHNTLKLTKIEIKNLCFLTINALEEILPLGSVVDLKLKSVRDIIPKSVEKFRVVIVDRFALDFETESYFEYVGVVYPLGKLKKDSVITFTSDIVEKVVYKGFSDEQEEEYIKLIKTKLLIDNAFVSASFLPKDKSTKIVSGLRGGY